MHTKRYVITIAMSPSKRYRFLLRKTIRKTILKRCHYDRLFFTGYSYTYLMTKNAAILDTKMAVTFELLALRAKRKGVLDV